MVEFLKNHISPKLAAKNVHELRLAHESKNRILSVEMMLRSSLLRTESRALHYREDYPRRDDPGWLALVKVRKKENAMELVKEPLPEKWWPDLAKPYRSRYPMRFAGED
jgi:succinate dehydrogenase/fumarate reductase flavoprotein subunit